MVVEAALLPRRGNASTMLAAAACKPTWRNFQELKHSFAFFSRDAAEHFAFGGTRLGGSDHPGEPFDQLDEHGTAGLIATSDGILRVGECTTSESDGSIWHMQRVGPFSSVGGHDYWSFYHRDFSTVQRELDRLPAGHQLGITAHVTGAVTTAGELIPYPPIHSHHVHIVPGVGEEYLMPTTVRPPRDPNPANHSEPPHHRRSKTRAALSVCPNSTRVCQSGGLDCYLRGERCWDMSVAIQQTADSQCTAEDGGTECFGRDYGSFAKVISEPLAIAAQLNDVRPASPMAPLVWWFQARSVPLIVWSCVLLPHTYRDELPRTTRCVYVSSFSPRSATWDSTTMPRATQ